MSIWVPEALREVLKPLSSYWLPTQVLRTILKWSKLTPRTKPLLSYAQMLLKKDLLPKVKNSMGLSTTRELVLATMLLLMLCLRQTCGGQNGWQMHSFRFLIKVQEESSMLDLELVQWLWKTYLKLISNSLEVTKILGIKSLDSWMKRCLSKLLMDSPLTVLQKPFSITIRWLLLERTQIFW